MSVQDLNTPARIEDNFRNQARQYRALLRWGVDKVFEDANFNPIFVKVRKLIDENQLTDASHLLGELQIKITHLEDQYPIQKKQIEKNLYIKIDHLESLLLNNHFNQAQIDSYFKKLEITRVAIQNDDWLEAKSKLSTLEKEINNKVIATEENLTGPEVTNVEVVSSELEVEDKQLNEEDLHDEGFQIGPGQAVGQAITLSEVNPSEVNIEEETEQSLADESSTEIGEADNNQPESGLDSAGSDSDSKKPSGADEDVDAASPTQKEPVAPTIHVNPDITETIDRGQKSHILSDLIDEETGKEHEFGKIDADIGNDLELYFEPPNIPEIISPAETQDVSKFNSEQEILATQPIESDDSDGATATAKDTSENKLITDSAETPFKADNKMVSDDESEGHHYATEPFVEPVETNDSSELDSQIADPSTQHHKTVEQNENGLIDLIENESITPVNKDKPEDVTLENATTADSLETDNPINAAIETAQQKTHNPVEDTHPLFRAQSAQGKVLDLSNMEKMLRTLCKSHVNNQRFSFLAHSSLIKSTLAGYSKNNITIDDSSQKIVLLRFSISRQNTLYIFGIPVDSNISPQQLEKISHQFTANFICSNSLSTSDKEKLVSLSKNKNISRKTFINKNFNAVSFTDIMQLEEEQQYSPTLIVDISKFVGEH